jgi:hypothetical protein
LISKKIFSSVKRKITLAYAVTSGFRGEDLKKSTNQKQELPVAAMFVN